MENRKKLHDYSLLLIFLSVLDLFTYFASLIASVINGTVSDALSTVEPDILGAVEVGLIIVACLMAVLTLSDAFIGIKGLKVARNPVADKGYITAAKVLFVLSILAFALHVSAYFEGSADVVQNTLTVVNTGLDVVVFAILIKVANAVRAEALASK